MTQFSLGLIETIGLAAAVEAADAAVKSANVVLVGYELARGDGMAVVKVQGEVGAVNAAVAAGAAAAARVNRVVATRVIARPADGIAGLVANRDTVGVRKAPAVAAAAPALLPASVPEPVPEPVPEAPAQPASADAEPAAEPVPEAVADTTAKTDPAPSQPPVRPSSRPAAPGGQRTKIK
ncbi:hypothetical protein TSO352_19950 [Azospirillum sp. TSO35-2]|nr:hypothetical protein TSO352_19950 [Azospirillum sp. TSO35-2]